MKNIFTLSAVFLALAFTSCTFVQRAEQKPERTVTVDGEGSVLVTPDIATISLAVNTFHRDVIIASQQNAEIVAKVINALVDAGFSKEAVSTSDYRITQDISNRNGIQYRGDYRVTNSINILARDISKVGNAIDVAVKAGANQFTSIDFSVSDMQAAVREARTLAIKNAYESAKLMAGTSGAALGKILTIEEVSNGYRSPQLYTQRNFVGNSMTDETSISPGKQNVTVTVHCVYEMISE